MDKCIVLNYEDHVKTACDKLRELKPGWDCYSAPSLDEAIIELAKDTAMQLRSLKHYKLDNLLPSISPGSDGSITITMQGDGWSMEVYIETCN